MSKQGFDKIIGQDFAKRVLVRAVREQSPTHAYLFLGLQGTGKTTTALEFAKALNCENPQDGNACGECPLCHMIEHGNSPDVYIWSPDGQNTKIDQMREMRDLAKFKPLRGKWKINIIEQADTLNDESANCILKLLEEPPPYVINMLLFRNPASMLPTIKSRCQMVRFNQVNTDELASRLIEDFDADEYEAAFLATYSQGRPGTAIQLLGNEDFFKKRDVIISVAAGIASKNPWLSLKLSETLRSFDEKDAAGKKRGARDMMIETLDIFVLWYRDLLAAKTQGESASVVNSDKIDEIMRQSGKYAHAGHLFNAVDAILSAKKAIMGNANPQIVTEALMMRLVI